MNSPAGVPGSVSVTSLFCSSDSMASLPGGDFEHHAMLQRLMPLSARLTGSACRGRIDRPELACGSRLDGLHDVVVARAAAQVAIHAELDLILAGIGIVSQQG